MALRPYICDLSDIPVDVGALSVIFTHTPRPWPDAVTLTFLRYCYHCALNDLPRWSPDDAPDWLRERHGTDAIGRKALSTIAGIPKARARRLLDDPSTRLQRKAPRNVGAF